MKSFWEHISLFGLQIGQSMFFDYLDERNAKVKSILQFLKFSKSFLLDDLMKVVFYSPGLQLNIPYMFFDQSYIKNINIYDIKISNTKIITEYIFIVNLVKDININTIEYKFN